MVKRALIVLAVACQSHDTPTPRVETSGSAAVPVATSRDAAAIAEPDVPDVDKQPKHEEPEQVDPGKQLVELGAVPAWQAVVDRTHYLERRGGKGVVYGTLGDAVADSPFTWLVDDTEGNGALAIRVKLDAPGKPGDRVALGGAWALDELTEAVGSGGSGGTRVIRRWYWHVSSRTALPPAVASTLKEPPAAPGHAIANGDLPAGVRPISKARENDTVYFTLAGQPPVLDGDGWPVADELGNPVAAILNLPGEHASYGAQDMRAADERWTLKRGQTYWVHVGVVHDHGKDKPLTMSARTVPVRVK
jgi:hypothetical protein